MCLGCDLKNGEKINLISNPKTDFKVFIENQEEVFKLHMTNERYHTTRDIYHCPFCGRTLDKRRYPN